MRISSVRSVVRTVRTAQHSRVAIAALATLTLAFHAAAFPSATSAAYPPSAEGATFAAATDHSDATRAALDVMAAGGNAVDGAIAASLVLGVVSPSASGIGGGGFALVWTASDAKARAFDFREVAPASFSTDVLWPKKKAEEKPLDRFGWTGPRGGAVGVPGEPAGLELLSRTFGKRSLADDAAPAVALARGGFHLSHHTADQVALFKERLQRSPTLASSFLAGGLPIGMAGRVKRPELAATLARYGAEGQKSIYEGPTAAKIVDSVRGAGGHISLEDLKAYSVKERAPLSRTIDGRTIYTMPAPSAGGLMLLEALGMYGANHLSPLTSQGFGSSQYLHTIAEVMRGAFADRARLAGDPELEPGTTAAFDAALDAGQLAARRARIEPSKTHSSVEFQTKEKGTSHLVVADKAGNVVSLTTTVNGPFGAGLVAGDSGILLNNELDDFTSLEDAKVFGLEGGGPNRPRPRARPVSSMTPTIVVEGGKPIVAVGGSGGPRIATGTTQALLARLLFDLDPNACVAHPRVHTQGATLFVDPEIVPDVREALRARGESVKEDPFTGSAVQMIAWRRTAGGATRVQAAADPRKGGLAAAR